MKRALVAIDPLTLKGKNFEHFCEMIRFFQQHGLISQTSVASIIHSSLYLMPYEFYNKEKSQLAKEERLKVDRACKGKFQYKTVRVLQSGSSANEELVTHLVRHGKRMGSDLLVLGSNDRVGLPYWLLGSLSETASLAAPIPVLILKASTPIRTVSPAPRFVVGVDVAAPPSGSDTSWIANLARSMRAQLDLVYVQPRSRGLFLSVRKRQPKADARKILQRQVQMLNSKGARNVKFTILAESRSIAHTIADFAESQHAWLTITTTAKRTRIQRLLLGSNARHVLALTRRPFLSLRPG